MKIKATNKCQNEIVGSFIFLNPFQQIESMLFRLRNNRKREYLKRNQYGKLKCLIRYFLSPKQ